MNENGSTRSSAALLSKYHPELIAGAIALFVLHTGLIPYDLSFGTSVEAGFSSAAVENPTLALVDIVGNIFLYVPVGFAFHWVLRRFFVNTALTTLLAITGGVLLSGSIEALQNYSPLRVSSIIDFVCNTVGTMIGALVFFAFHRIAPKAMAAIKTELLNHPLPSWLRAYAAMLIIFAVLPFSFSLSPNLIKHSIKSSHLLPFSSVMHDYHQADLALAAGNDHAYAMAKWSALKHWSRWMAEILSFIPFVWLLHFWLVKFYRFNASCASALVWWYACGLALGLSFIQIFVLSRGLDVTDLLARWLGIALGTQVIRITSPANDDEWMAKTRSCWRKIAPTACVMSLLYILYTGVIPLTLGDPIAEAASSLKSPSILPFFGYFETRFDLMMDDILEKMAGFALFGFSLISSCSSLKTKPLSQRLTRSCSAAVAIATTIEVVQLFVPVRVASLTDLILAGVGCSIGVIAHDLIHTYLQDTFAHATTDRLALDANLEAQRELSITDALIATLADQKENAPQEIVPRTSAQQNEANTKWP